MVTEGHRLVVFLLGERHGRKGSIEKQSRLHYFPFLSLGMFCWFIIETNLSCRTNLSQHLMHGWVGKWFISLAKMCDDQMANPASLLSICYCYRPA